MRNLKQIIPGVLLLWALQVGAQARYHVDRQQSRPASVDLAVANQSDVGAIRITTDPSGAEIEIDGVLAVSKSPCLVQGLVVGKRYLILTPPNDYLPMDTIFTVRANTTGVLYVTFIRKTDRMKKPSPAPRVKIDQEAQPRSQLSWAGNKGSSEIDWTGSYQRYSGELYNLDGKPWDNSSISITYKYFFLKNFAIGPVFSWDHSNYPGGDMKYMDFGVSTAYYFRKNSDQTLVPYLDLRWLNQSASNNSVKSDGSKWSSSVGLACFVNPTVAIKPHLSYERQQHGGNSLEQYKYQAFTTGVEIAAYIFPNMTDYFDAAWSDRYRQTANLDAGSVSLGGQLRYSKGKQDYNTYSGTGHSEDNSFGGSVSAGWFVDDRWNLGILCQSDYNNYDYGESSHSKNLTVGVGPYLEHYIEGRGFVRPFWGLSYLWRWGRNNDNYTDTYGNYIEYNSGSSGGSFSVFGGVALFASPTWAVKIGANLNFDQSSAWYQPSQGGRIETGRVSGTVMGLFSGLYFYL